MFQVLYVDPPWSFNNQRTGGNLKSGAVQKYETMELLDIHKLPIHSVLSPSSVLFLWVPTTLKFSHGWTTMQAWGFRYVTTVYWDKQRLGMGFWFRNQVEELLVGVRGDVRPFRCQVPNIIHHPVGEHSEKPKAFRSLIEQATGAPAWNRNLELFARRKAVGWTSSGNAITGQHVLADLRMLAGGDVLPGNGWDDAGPADPMVPGRSGIQTMG